MYTLILITQVYFSVAMVTVPGLTEDQCRALAERWVSQSRDIAGESEIQTWANRAECVRVER